jgi:predicted acetyltransferase
MKTDFKFTGVKSGELDRLIEIVGDSLIVVSPDHKKHFRSMWKRMGLSHTRVVRVGSRIVGGMACLDTGHYFNGKLVPGPGVMAVGVAPEFRRMGAGTFLMAEALREFHKNGAPISSLVPANMPLYRKVGYEYGIERHALKKQTREISVRNSTCEVEPHEGKDYRRFKEVYRKFCETANGAMEREKLLWEVVLNPYWRGEVSRFLIKRNGKYEGYAVLCIKSSRDPIFMPEYCVLTRDAAERLLTLLADHSSIMKSVLWLGPTHDPIIQLLPDRIFQIETLEGIMFRIVSVERALEARGYLPAVNAEVQFEVADDIIDENNGRFVLKVKDGKAAVKKGGKGTLKIDIRTLAQIYTGIMSATESRVTGLIEGPQSEMEKMDVIFSGSRPWCRDDF